MGTDLVTDADILQAVGIAAANSIVFIKQYGEIRTCTSAMRAMIMANFTNVFVLMHVLGDKHSPPCDLAAFHVTARQKDDPAWYFVTASTLATPSETTFHGDYFQLRFLKALAEPLYAAYCGGRLGALICTKHPYDWAMSVLRYRHWPLPMIDGSWEEDAAVEFFRSACRQFSARYRAWLDATFPMTGTVVVRGEDLRRDPIRVLETCEHTFGLKRATGSLSAIDYEVGPVFWDNMPREAVAVPVPAEKTPHGGCLTARVRRVIDDHIDWETMSRLGYERFASTREA
jgi:hypothetical protein